ncbi:MAG: DUF29 domain-containing protein, partial [Microcystis panniformis]
MSSTAYETDYNQWLKETVKQLRERNFEQVDWDNLIKEIESMGKSDRRALMSLLTRLIEHLFQQTLSKLLLKTTPELRPGRINKNNFLSPNPTNKL